LYIFGNWYTYDQVASLVLTLEAPPYDFSILQVNALYTAMFIPNLILPLLGGIFLDKVGIK